MTDTTIINTLMTEVVDYLAEKLIDEVTDDTRAGLVRKGKLQADPTLRELNILIRDGGEGWRHKRAPDDHHAISQVGAFEMGGTVAEFWLRRFIIHATLFYPAELDRNVAIESSNVILARIQSTLYDFPMPQGEDSFGEQAIQLDTEEWFLEESGGPGMFIRKGQLRFEVLTEIAR